MPDFTRCLRQIHSYCDQNTHMVWHINTWGECSYSGTHLDSLKYVFICHGAKKSLVRSVTSAPDQRVKRRLRGRVPPKKVRRKCKGVGSSIPLVRGKGFFHATCAEKLSVYHQKSVLALTRWQVSISPQLQWFEREIVVTAGVIRSITPRQRPLGLGSVLCVWPVSLAGFWAPPPPWRAVCATRRCTLSAVHPAPRWWSAAGAAGRTEVTVRSLMSAHVQVTDRGHSQVTGVCLSTGRDWLQQLNPNKI